MLFNFKDIGIDLGTSNILVAVKGKGIVLREPSVIAINQKTGNVIATGEEAKAMIGKTPDDINVIRPIKEGVIADYKATSVLLKDILSRVCKKYEIGKPRVIVGVPSGITEVEERAVQETVFQAGAREVHLIEEPMAAAIGADINISEPSGNIVVDIGGGTTEVVVSSLGGIVVSESIRIAGDKLTEAIIEFIKRELDVIIGEQTAELIKKQVGCALPLMSEMSIRVKGRDLTTGLPREIEFTSTLCEIAMRESIWRIVDIIKMSLEKTPPELSSDLIQKGIVLTGGGALIQNLDKLISMETGMPVYVANEPMDCVVKGTEKALENIEKLKSVLKNSRNRKN